MTRRAVFFVIGNTVLLGVSGACRQHNDPGPAPDARRPVLRTETELAADRAERVRAGQVVPTSAPALVSPASPSSAPARARVAVAPPPNAIQADILMVNDAVLTVAEVLYPLREKVPEARRTQTRQGLLEQLRRWVRQETQREIGSLLVYTQALATLSEQQKEQLKAYVDHELEKRISLEFGDSAARLSHHLARYGLTVEQYRARFERQIVVQQYTREILMPAVTVRRDELRELYRRNEARYRMPETRELLVIEAPFEKFVPEGQTWDSAPPPARSQAKLRAVRHIRAAQEALGERPFEDVAREFSHGAHASQGGSWGQIGQPLQPPYDEPSQLIFEFAEGQVSEPIETGTGWYIVKCGRIEPATSKSFAEAQEEIRQQLVEERFNDAATEYVAGLAAKATFGSFEAFVAAAIRRASAEDWPDAEGARPDGSVTNSAP